MKIKYGLWLLIVMLLISSDVMAKDIKETPCETVPVPTPKPIQIRTVRF